MLFQSGPDTALEIFVRAEGGEAGGELVVRGLTVRDFASLFRGEISARTVCVFRMCPSVLNPEYWEPWTESSAREMVRRIGGVVEDRRGGTRKLWRADRVGPGRAIRDVFGVRPEITRGPIFWFSGGEFLKISKALTDPYEPILFALPKRSGSAEGRLREEEVVAGMNGDLEPARGLGRAGAVLYRNDGEDGAVRLVFADPGWLRRTLEGAIRGWVHRRSGDHVALMSRRTLEDLLHLVDGVGFLADPAADFVDKGRTVEVTLRAGETAWSPRRPAGDEEDAGLPRALLYYDRTSGIWALTL